MAEPTIVVMHPDRKLVQRLVSALEPLDVCVRTVDSGSVDPEVELRRFDPNVLFAPISTGYDVARSLEELTPGCRWVTLRDEAAGEDARAFASLTIDSGLDVEAARDLARRGIESFRPAGTVLVVEDSPVNQGLVTDVLHARDYRVLRASSAEEGLEIVEHVRPDVALMDIYLPGMSGIDAVRQLKGCPATATIPIVMLSANGTDRAIAEALEAGAIDFMVKPFSPRGLLDKLALIVEKRELLAHA